MLLMGMEAYSQCMLVMVLTLLAQHRWLQLLSQSLPCGAATHCLPSVFFTLKLGSCWVMLWGTVGLRQGLLDQMPHDHWRSFPLTAYPGCCFLFLHRP